MKSNLKLALLIGFMLIVEYSQAQGKIGPKLGLNLSTMTLRSPMVWVDPKTLIGFNVGIITEISLKNDFGLQSGLIFSTKGSKYSSDSFDVYVMPRFLEIPINALYKFNVGSAKLFLLAGPYFAFGIGGTYRTQNETYEINFGTGEDKDMRSFDLGVNIGAGIDIKNFEISTQCGLGIANLAASHSDYNQMKVRVIGISLTYLFGVD